MELATILLTASQFDDLDHYLIIATSIGVALMLLFGAWGRWGRP